MSPPHPISIWHPVDRADGLYFERPPPSPLGDHYAQHPAWRAEKPKGTRRVLFLGESVAAGYLYAPHLTPAGVLAHQLRAAGNGPYEVIDLARTNETLGSLVATARAGLQLHPDALVVFAGNNWNLLETPAWSPYVPAPADRQRYGEALHAQGLPGPLARSARSRLLQAANALAALHEIAHDNRVPVIVVVPEVNLADWPHRQPVARLPGNEGAQWYAHLEAACTALDQAAYPAVLAHTEAMMVLDGYTCPTPHRLQVQAHVGMGNPRAAAQAARNGIDADAYPTQCFLGTPQSTPMDQALLRKTASVHGFAVVDLPALFAAHTGTLLPGRRLFLDYCHLTREGIQVAMAGVTAQVLRLLEPDREPVAWQALLKNLPPPPCTPEAEATALFGAALHTAHRLLGTQATLPLLTYWCTRALEVSPGVAGAMMDLIDARTAPAPAVMTAAQQRNLVSPYRLGFQHGWRYPYLDLELITAIAAALDAVEAPEGRSIAPLLQTRHGLSETPTELAVPAFYHLHPLARFYPEVMPLADLPRRATYRAAWPVSRFGFICKAEADVKLHLTARLPELDAGSCTLHVNGRVAGRLRLNRAWGRHPLTLPRALLRPGINHLSLTWPVPVLPEAPLAEVAHRLIAGREATLHPVFGEVFSLTVHI